MLTKAKTIRYNPNISAKSILTMRKSLGIRFKIYSTVGICVVFLVGGPLVLVRSGLQTHLSDLITSDLNAGIEAIKTDVQQKSNYVLSSLQMLPSNTLANAMSNNDREHLIGITSKFMKSTGFDFMTFTDKQGKVFLRVHAPERHGDNISNQSCIQQILQGKTASGIEISSQNTPNIGAGIPITDDNGRIVGAVTAGYNMNDSYLAHIRNISGSNVCIFVGKTLYKTSIAGIAEGTPLLPDMEQQVMERGETYTGQVPGNGVEELLVLTPLRGSNNAVVGSVSCSKSTSLIDDIRNSIRNRMIVLYLIVVSFGLTVIITVLDRQVIKVIQDLVLFTNDFADGDLTKRMEVKNMDEVGQLVVALNRMGDSLRGMALKMHNISNSLNDASQQMSAGAQQLSDGANQQASSTEEISSSMEEISSMIEANTEHSQEANNLAIQAVAGVQQGNEATNKTANYMDEISRNTAVVSEIAFQTNILALNAAVEAARAGEHGRGFAVVAAEVKRLAERSATAAKQIEEVTSKGTVLARDAGETLARLVPEIEKTSQLVQDIATSSMEQQNGVTQINSASQQLNHVVQENASASEQLAANADQLQNMAIQLKELISFFKLDNHA